MAVQASLQKLRTTWVERISRELAAGEGVRADFGEQLQRFYTLLEQTIVTGDTAWLDPFLYDWGHSPTETDLEQADYHVSFVIDRILPFSGVRNLFHQQYLTDTFP